MVESLQGCDEMGDHLRYTVLVFNQTTQINSAWPSSISRRNDYSHCSEICVAVGPVTRTVGTLTQLVKGAGC